MFQEYSNEVNKSEGCNYSNNKVCHF